MGLYIVILPSQASSVSPVLDLDTAMVYPNFNMQNDEFFEKVYPTAANSPTLYHWKQIYSFKHSRLNHL